MKLYNIRVLLMKGVRKEVGVKNPSLSLRFYENFITCAKEI